MRARDRQDELLGLLRRRGSLTVQELAGHFDVTERTIHRDLERLRGRGFAIEGAPGPGGGMRLRAGGAPIPTLLETREVVGLVVALSLARADSQIPFGRPARSALDKLIGALPEARARAVRQLLLRIVVGPPATKSVAESLTEVNGSILERVEEAFANTRCLSFRYRDRHGSETTRRAEPHALLVQSPAWYLLAVDLDREQPRMFRLDRIGRSRLLREAFRPRPVARLERLYRDYFDVETLAG